MGPCEFGERDEIRIRGTAPPGTWVRIVFPNAGEEHSVDGTADRVGRWSISLGPAGALALRTGEYWFTFLSITPDNQFSMKQESLRILPASVVIGRSLAGVAS